MATLHQITGYLDAFLRISEIRDFPGAHNGLQLGEDQAVTRVAAAVDACEATIDSSIECGAQLLLVHHGMFWSGSAPMTGAMFRKVAKAVRAGLAIYSAHLPLDRHPVLGNNALLAGAIGLPVAGEFFEEMGERIGLRLEAEIPVDELIARLEEATGARPHVCKAGPSTCRNIGLVTGGAGSGVAKAAAEGIDTFITGEGPHWSYTAAEEASINLIYAGHYATETFGVRALAEHLAGHFGLAWSFIDHPTGL